MIPQNWPPSKLPPNKMYPQPQLQKKIEIPPGKHLQVCGGTSFILYDYYQTIKIIGNGSFGIVASCTDTRTNQQVAIKKVKNVFRDLIDSKRILREIKLLMFLKHPNIIGLIDIITPDKEDFEDIYMVFELMQSDLEKVINSEQKLSDQHIKFFLKQILVAIHYLHSADVIHRDLKPSNLFVNRNCQLRVGDLNLARKFENICHITEYVVTRWYRAPEIILSQAEYKKAIDVWSIGCIFAELIIRCPLFRGEHYLNQIECIVAILGTPQEEDFPYKVEEQSMKYIKQLPKRTKIPFEEVFKNANPLAIDLLRKMLVYNPNKRYTIEQCLKHEYFNDTKMKLKTCENIFDWGFDNLPADKKIIQKEMYETSLQFQKQNASNQPPTTVQNNPQQQKPASQQQQQQQNNNNSSEENKKKEEEKKNDEQEEKSKIQTTKDIQKESQDQIVSEQQTALQKKQMQEAMMAQQFKKQQLLMQQSPLMQQQQQQIKSPSLLNNNMNNNNNQGLFPNLLTNKANPTFFQNFQQQQQQMQIQQSLNKMAQSSNNENNTDNNKNNSINLISNSGSKMPSQLNTPQLGAFPVCVEKHMSFSDKLCNSPLLNSHANNNFQKEQQQQTPVSSFQPPNENNNNNAQNNKQKQQQQQQNELPQNKIMRSQSFGFNCNSENELQQQLLQQAGGGGGQNSSSSNENLQEKKEKQQQQQSNNSNSNININNEKVTEEQEKQSDIQDKIENDNINNNNEQKQADKVNIENCNKIENEEQK